MSDPKPQSGRLTNYAATMAAILLGLWVYSRDDNFLWAEFNVRIEFQLFGDDRAVSTWDLLAWLSALYAVVLIPYYAMRPGYVSDARRMLSYLRLWALAGKQPEFGADERRAALCLALKSFFVPLMLGFLINNIGEVIRHWTEIAADDAGTRFALRLNSSFFFLLLAALYAIDVVIFTFGYLVEARSLRNEIKSVDPTVLGWVSCLICYPPFNHVGFAFFAWQRIDGADFGYPMLEATLAAISVAAIAIFAWSSVALGFRASNLTNRGVVARGPYRWVRHPAYTVKNLAVWISAVPTLTDAFSNSAVSNALWILTCLVVWSLIYVVRAITEERHLLMTDNGYAEYQAKVRFRFVPGLL
jgi:protein-S-isoprenylcysteine O-methyltransferase Ste14